MWKLSFFSFVFLSRIWKVNDCVVARSIVHKRFAMNAGIGLTIESYSFLNIWVILCVDRHTCLGLRYTSFVSVMIIQIRPIYKEKNEHIDK